MSKNYSTNLTAQEWVIVEPYVRRQRMTGPKTQVDLREVLNAIYYLDHNSCTWRDLPGDFPAWGAVRYYYDKWATEGTFAELNLALGRELRRLLGREAEPSAAIMDSQSVKTVAHSADESGYDGGKKVKGRKRFILVDTLGLLLAVLVTAASVPERVGGEQLLKQAHDFGQERLEVVFADAGYDGPKLENAVAAESGWRLECSPRAKKRELAAGEVGFVVQQWRWIVERTFGWLNWWRRLAKDYERKPLNSETMVQLAMSRMTLRRLAKLQVSQNNP